MFMYLQYLVLPGLSTWHMFGLAVDAACALFDLLTFTFSRNSNQRRNEGSLEYQKFWGMGCGNVGGVEMGWGG